MASTRSPRLLYPRIAAEIVALARFSASCQEQSPDIFVAANFLMLFGTRRLWLPRWRQDDPAPSAATGGAGLARSGIGPYASLMVS